MTCGACACAVGAVSRSDDATFEKLPDGWPLHDTVRDANGTRDSCAARRADFETQVVSGQSLASWGAIEEGGRRCRAVLHE